MADVTHAGETDCSLRQFERNRYFYAKLLTARDFNDQDRYYNEKRQMLNRLLDGTGVACGLRTTTTPAGPQKVHVTRGLAIDGCGREIVVATDRDLDLTTIEGAPSSVPTGGTKLYLALCYDECLREPVPAPSNSSTADEVCENNRILETCRFRLVDKLPDAEKRDLDTVWNSRVTLVEAAGIKLERIAPRWVHRDGVFAVRLIVTPTTPNPGTPALTVTEDLEGLTAVSGLEGGRIFLPASQGTGFERTYRLRAGLNAGPAKITATQVDVVDKPAFRTSPASALEIVDDAVSDHVVAALFDSEQVACHECSTQTCVPLAVLTLTGADSSFAVTRIEPFPQRQFAVSNSLLYDLVSFLETRIGPQGPGQQGPKGDKGDKGDPGGAVSRVTTGLATLRFNNEARTSTQVPSRFDHSRFCVQLGIQQEERSPVARDEVNTTYGVFPPTAAGEGIWLQAVVPRSGKGLFSIVGHAMSRTTRDVVVRWCALELPPEDSLQPLGTTQPTTAVSGVGAATAQKLSAAGIPHAAALAAASPEEVAAALGHRDVTKAEALITAAREIAKG